MSKALFAIFYGDDGNYDNSLKTCVKSELMSLKQSILEGKYSREIRKQLVGRSLEQLRLPKNFYEK